jgi:hypothetical protein
MNERPTPETDAEHKQFAMGGFTLDFCRKLERERDEAREELHDIRLNLGEDADGYTLLHAVCVLQNERNEAMEDSLEQARLLGMGSEREAKLISDLEFRRGLYKVQEQYLETARRERDEAREALTRITEAAQAVVDRWEQPAWKDTEPTAAVIYRLRDALGREAE